jgi:putative membrane protein
MNQSAESPQSPKTGLEDPRIYFAAERTLLAWMRTGISVLGLGFLVARFGLFLALARTGHEPAHQLRASTVIGTAFVWLGAAIMLAATLQHARFTRRLSPLLRPSNYWSQISLVVAACLSILAAALGVYLLNSLMYLPAQPR